MLSNKYLPNEWCTPHGETVATIFFSVLQVKPNALSTLGKHLAICRLRPYHLTSCEDLLSIALVKKLL